LLKVRWWYGLKIGGDCVTSPSPEKLGRSSKSRTKSPCSPHVVGNTDADAEVLVTREVSLTDSEVALAVTDPGNELKDGVESWLIVEVALALLESEPIGAVTVLDARSEVDDEVEIWLIATVASLEEGA